jgi:hypothetical protein
MRADVVVRLFGEWIVDVIYEGAEVRTSPIQLSLCVTALQR